MRGVPYAQPHAAAPGTSLVRWRRAARGVRSPWRGGERFGPTHHRVEGGACRAVSADGSHRLTLGIKAQTAPALPGGVHAVIGHEAW